MKICAIIPAHNEEENIERCVRSVLWCDSIVVLWTGSDKTGEKARKLGASVVSKNKSLKPNFISVQKNINWALHTISSDWFLRIDADEQVTKGLEKEIKNVIQKKTDISAYGIGRNQYFWGGFLKGGDWYYDRLVRLFKKGSARYKPIVPVHEQFKVVGKVGYLKEKLNHYSHPTLSAAAAKFSLYSKIEAQYHSKKPKSEIALRMLFLPPYIFLRWELYHHGYRDGLRGAIAALMRASYEFLIWYRALKYKNKSKKTSKAEGF